MVEIGNPLYTLAQIERCVKCIDRPDGLDQLGVMAFEEGLTYVVSRSGSTPAA